MDSNMPRSEETEFTGEENLRQKLAEYEARLIEVAELTASVRHEINNPLTGLIGQAQLLLRDDLSEKVRKRVETIEQLSLRIRDIVARLRVVQRPNEFFNRNIEESETDTPPRH